MKNLFLTGDIKVGKSTILNSFLSGFQGIIGGFKTVPFYQENREKVFLIKNLNKFSKQQKDNSYICHYSTILNKLIPNTLAFETLGVKILQECLKRKPDLIIMDELGLFETEALIFQNKVEKCLSSDIPVLGVIKNKESKFLNKLRSRNDLKIITVTLENRDFKKNKFGEYCSKLLNKN